MKNKITNNKIGAVMVVGSGIAGMQASLDLSNSGFKVYLVEETDGIGGRMAQLDKTFPTNDCAMCTISPKLIEVDKHPNIEIITRTKLLSLEGHAGNFKATIEKSPRFIDLEKCNACGDCVEVCPVEISDPHNYNLGTKKPIGKKYPQTIPNGYAIDKGSRPPCVMACPANVNCQGYTALVAQGKFAEAVKLVHEKNPFLSVCGRICHHPCESECHRADEDEALAINPIKRFLGDWALNHPEEIKQVFEKQQIKDELLDKQKEENKNHKIAVIGSGPAGLTTAEDLAKLGYRVTIFESSDVLGGMLRTGIPDYRLPKSLLEAEINLILEKGVETRMNTTLGKDISLDDLKNEGFESVFLAIGAQKGRILNIDGADLPQVYNGIDFLKNINLNKDVRVGEEVIVIGGGNVAIDVAMSCSRKGAAKVKIVCLESRGEMPAHNWEISDAEEEGIEIINSWGPLKINGSDKVEGLHVKKCLSVFDSDGKFSPQFDESEIKNISADTVIFAIGQGLDREIVGSIGIESSGSGWINANKITLETSIKGIFGGGDAVLGPSSAIDAIALGHEAAVSIDRFIHDENMYANREKDKSIAPKPNKVIEPKNRVKEKRSSVENRKGNFDELSYTITEEEAIAEASRCMSCGICSECQQCVFVCEAGAINHKMTPEITDLDVGAVIIATGFEPFDAKGKPEYGWERYANVLTAPEFERELSASGPFSGKMTRLSDLGKPKRIAWIQCVGSRDQLCGKEYCSSVCCMYATKQAICAREEGSEATIFYNDIRAFGKGFDKYYDRAKNELGVRYIKSIVSSVKQLYQSKDLLIKYIDEQNKPREEQFDMIVLSVGLVPSRSTKELFEKLNIEYNKYGFCESNKLSPCSTNVEGIFVCGAGESPKDIPESVMEASSASALAGELLGDVRGSLVNNKQYPAEIDVMNDEPRVGVFVCHCGSNIARIIDVEQLVEFAAKLPHVVHAERNLYTCSSDTQKKMIELIKEKNLNRVVVSSCTPRTHEPLFQDTIREAGLNKYLFEMANIRDQCSWVHPDMPELALDKAKDLVAMAVSRAVTLESLKEKEYPVNKSALIIGGGASGMTAALSLADQGFKSYIIEKTEQLGGNLRNIKRLINGTHTEEFLNNLIEKVNNHHSIDVFLNAHVEEFSGHVGEFQTTIISNEQSITLNHGVVLFTTGAKSYEPTEYLFGKNPNVIKQIDFEKSLHQNPESAKNLKNVVMIQCVGSREEPRNYCSRICCQEAVKNALHLKEINPATNIYVLYRDMRTYGFDELYYLKAREQGVVFIRYDVDKKPIVEDVNGNLKIKVYDTTLNSEIELNPDKLVLSAGIVSDDTLGKLMTKFKTPVNEDGFLMEAHMKLRPLDFANEGMFMAGLAHAPKQLHESLAQAKGAASRAMTILSKDKLTISGSIAEIDEEKCAICLTCVRACPYGVPFVNDNNKAEIDSASCQGCGTCAGACPAKAIHINHFKDEQIMAKCDAFEIIKQMENL